VIELRKVAEGMGVANVTKQKDLPTWRDRGFRLVSVDLGFNTRGKPYSSCVVEAMEYQQEDDGPRLTGEELILKNIIDNLRSGPREPRPARWSKSGGQVDVADVFERDELLPFYSAEVFDEDETKTLRSYVKAAKGLRDKGALVLHENKIGILRDEAIF